MILREARIISSFALKFELLFDVMERVQIKSTKECVGNFSNDKSEVTHYCIRFDFDSHQTKILVEEKNQPPLVRPGNQFRVRNI